jgi:hypothetical protein
MPSHPPADFALPAGPRLDWDELPEHVLGFVADALGAPVVAADTRFGGFSPGVAACVEAGHGTRAFVKAVSTDQNPDTPGLLRDEIDTLRRLPHGVAVPKLRGVLDDGHWVAMVFDEVRGRAPTQPWRHDEIVRALTALDRLVDQLTPAPDVTAGVPWRTFADVHPESFTGWARLAAQPPDDLDGWSRRHLDRLVELESRWDAASEGKTLGHGDLRADNMLLTEQVVYPGGVAFVDWAWAATCAPWVDPVLLLGTADLPGARRDELLTVSAACRGLPDEIVNVLLAMLAGMLAAACRRPPVPSLPTLRGFQRKTSEVALSWLRHRVDWR